MTALWRAAADSVAPGAIALRRSIHAEPELSWDEWRTTERVVAELERAGLSPKPFDGIPGAVADLRIGTGDGPVLVVRADLDALATEDRTDGDHRSRVAGVAHACGHDVHTAVAAGTAAVLANEAERLAGDGVSATVRFVFQPAEEAIPGGARTLVERGVVDDAAAIWAVHCDPSKPVGTIGVAAGPVTSAADKVTLRVEGPGGHTARPHLTVDLVGVLGALITGLPAGLARLNDPRDAVSLVFGQVAAGDAPNVIPRVGSLGATLRTRSRKAWDEAPGHIERLVTSIAEPLGADVALTHERGNPPVENDPALADRAARVLAAVLGPDHVAPTVQSAGSEDFSWYLDTVPGLYLRLGVAPRGGGAAADLHRGDFDVDEGCIGVGIAALAALVADRAASTLRR